VGRGLPVAVTAKKHHSGSNPHQGKIKKLKTKRGVKGGGSVRTVSQKTTR